MTYEEAIQVLTNHIDPGRNTIRVNSALVYAIEATEKQIPKKVLPDTEYLEGICPCCGVHFLDRSTKFCGNCGQALNWENDNE